MPRYLLLSQHIPLGPKHMNPELSQQSDALLPGCGHAEGAGKAAPHMTQQRCQHAGDPEGRRGSGSRSTALQGGKARGLSTPPATSTARAAGRFWSTEASLTSHALRKGIWGKELTVFILSPLSMKIDNRVEVNKSINSSPKILLMC